LLNSAQLALLLLLPDALHVSLVPLWILTTSATVVQDTLKPMELVLLALPSAMVAKHRVSAQLALILKEDLIKTVIAQLASLMMVLPHASPATHSAKLAPTRLHALHASAKTTEA
jgi:hypothetical protein